MKQRRDYSVVLIDAFDGTLISHPNTGCLQGDKNAGDDFCDVFHQPILDWHQRLLQQDNTYHKCYTKCAIFGTIHDLSLSTFVDDIRKLHIVQPPTATHGQQIIANANHQLDTCLGNYGFAQNLEKQVHLPSLKNRSQNRLVSSLIESGKVADFARYLGRLLSARNSNAPERRNRLRFTTIAWVSMGTFWFTPKVPFRAKRLVFLAHIQGTILSGGRIDDVIDVDGERGP